MSGGNLLWRCGRFFYDADEGDLRAAIDVVLVAAQDERFRSYNSKFDAAGNRARVRGNLIKFYLIIFVNAFD